MSTEDSYSLSQTSSRSPWRDKWPTGGASPGENGLNLYRVSPLHASFILGIILNSISLQTFSPLDRLHEDVIQTLYDLFSFWINEYCFISCSLNICLLSSSTHSCVVNSCMRSYNSDFLFPDPCRVGSRAARLLALAVPFSYAYTSLRRSIKEA